MSMTCPNGVPCLSAPVSPRPSDLRVRARLNYSRPSRSSAFEKFHVAVLLSVFPCAVFWCPVYTSGALGNVTLLDCALMALWATSLALFLGTRTQLPYLARRCSIVCLSAVLIGCCYAIAATVFGRTENMVSDVLRFMKIFGFPSIIPLSICLASKARIHRLLTGAALVSLIFNIGVSFTGYQDKLPLFNHFSELTAGQEFRPTGAVSNPNDYGYMSVASLAFAAAWWCSTKIAPAFHRLLCFGAIVTSLYGIASSGSRSAMVGLFCGGVYFVTTQHISIAKKIGFVGVFVGFVMSAWQLSAVFQERMDTAITQRSQELNFVGRLEAQAISVRTWVAWPLGVGSSNMPEATTPYATGSQLVGAVRGSDSIYVDMLVGAGIDGLALLLICLGSCWRLSSRSTLGPRTGVFRAAIVSMFFFGFATLAPATSFVAPFFFAIVGLAALPEAPPRAASARISAT